MNPQELLALLTVRVQRFHMAPGGIPNLTPEDVAHALGMIQSDDARIYARLKYCGQTEYAEGVALSIRRKMLMRAMNEEWRIHKPGFVLEMAYLILAEAVDPHTCTWCHGRAEIKPEAGPVIVCDACKGHGRRVIRDSDRARLLGLQRASWSNTWGERYRIAQVETVDRWEDLFVGAVKKRLGA